MPRSETIRGLERGLQVLQALQSNPIASLHEIHLATRISKPSLLRVLNTLEHAGYVSRRLVDGHYRISAFARMGRKRDRYDRVAEAAAPVLDRLCQNVRWPSDLMVPAGDHMERRETNQPYSPFFVHPWYRDRFSPASGEPILHFVRRRSAEAFCTGCADRRNRTIGLRAIRSGSSRFLRRCASEVMPRAIQSFAEVIMDSRHSMTGSQRLPYHCLIASGSTVL